jgi:hypothetical protein
MYSRLFLLFHLLYKLMYNLLAFSCLNFDKLAWAIWSHAYGTTDHLPVSIVIPKVLLKFPPACLKVK